MNKNQYCQIFIVLFCIYITLIACNFTSFQSTPVYTPTPPEWITDWLEKPACSPPCWETIQPGITSIDAIQSIKQKYPYMSVETNRNSTIIRMVSLNLASDDKLPIKLLISKFGYPTYVRIYKCDPNVRCETHIIFDDIGLVLNAYPDDIGGYDANIVDLTADTSIFNIYFLESGLDNYFNIFNGNARNELTRWKDYGKYSNP